MRSDETLLSMTRYSHPAKRWLTLWTHRLSFFTFVGVILTSSMLGDLSGRTRNVHRNILHNRSRITRKATKEFPEDQPVVICSDSPEWVNEQELFSGDRFLVSEPTDKYSDGSYEPFVDLCIMSLCSGAIIANSSLSWWGAWLQNKRGKVVAPKQWFGTDYKDKNTKDLYCPEWIVI